MTPARQAAIHGLRTIGRTLPPDERRELVWLLRVVRYIDTPAFNGAFAAFISVGKQLDEHGISVHYAREMIEVLMDVLRDLPAAQCRPA